LGGFSIIDSEIKFAARCINDYMDKSCLDIETIKKIKVTLSACWGWDENR
jgi:hypothetical protein